MRRPAPLGTIRGSVATNDTPRAGRNVRDREVHGMSETSTGSEPDFP